MLHPQTELGNVSPSIGFGVFARSFIPKGTIVYIKDPLEITISPGDLRLDLPDMRTIVDRYSYLEPTGAKVISWDLAKYVNHNCDPNTISTGYGFEIAIRDIHEGEEITDDYGLLNIEKPMTCSCGSSKCRKRVRPDDLQRYYPGWDIKVKEALSCYLSVTQPLSYLLDDLTRFQLERYLAKGTGYIPVNQLYFDQKPRNSKQQAV